MKKNIVIIHYNTPHLTECLVRSINLHVNDAVIYIFDNSDVLPFTAHFDNVTVLDNTKGEIIDFEEWLENFPKKIKSNGKTNNYGSAKHCYSVEKCMELLKEPFILLDSDILLKKDISCLFDDNYIYIGETITQPNSSIKRVLPYLCFINTTKCIEHDVHYFDENYMHGLCFNEINKKADSYDTGASFFLKADSYKHKEITLNDYIVHFGHGSWDKKDEVKTLTVDEWLSINKKYYSKNGNRRVVYTCIVGDYDILTDPTYISYGFDYVCFTDNKDFKSDIWEIRDLPKETENLTPVKKQRYVKINPHKVLSEYDLSIWVDGNVLVKGDLNSLLDEAVYGDCSVYVPQHPYRFCIYEEANVVMLMKKDTKENVEKQINRYREDGFPEHCGLLQSNILIRRHNDEGCISLMEKWFEEVKNGSHRDQLSFNYAAWLNQNVKVCLLDRKIYDSEWFKWKVVHNILRKKPQIEENIKPQQKKSKLEVNELSTY